MTDQADSDGWVEIERFRRRRDADEHALVLLAMGISCHIAHEPGATALLVPTSEVRRAREQLVAYASENGGPRGLHQPAWAVRDGIDGVLVCAALLLYLYMAPRRGAFGQDWLGAGAAQAGLIGNGEWWRTVTALGLHADPAHLAGNVILGGIFALLVVQHLGTGPGWLAILMAGALGNGVNAILHPATHTAIGASTAVFAALGILSAINWRRPDVVSRPGLRRWAPLGAGVMFLAFMGTGGERTDVGAHIAGFMVGVGAGLFLCRPAVLPILASGRARVWCAGAALGLFILSWTVALAING